MRAGRVDRVNMVLTVCMAAVLLSCAAVRGAQKKDGGGDDEWVHLPNKCEGSTTTAYRVQGFIDLRLKRVRWQHTPNKML